MRNVLVALACVAALGVFAGTASAAWKPGQAAYITVSMAATYLEGQSDFAFCRGVPAYGHRGKYPYDRFLRFDCGTDHAGMICRGTRYRSINGLQPGSYVLVTDIPGRCYD